MSASSILLKSVMCSAVLLTYYWVFLRNRRLHQYNRFFILLSVAASVLLPFLHIEWIISSTKAPENPVFKMLEIAGNGAPENEPAEGSGHFFSISQILILLYSLVILAFLIMMITKILGVYRLKRKYNSIPHDHFLLIVTPLEKAPFSFMNMLFWKDNIDMESSSGQQILKHELVHIHQKHTLDKLFLQLATAVFWINPFLWLLQKELSVVHEFIADEEAVKDNDTEVFALMLLQAHYGNSFREIVHPFFQSPVKRRLVMLQKIKNLNHAAMRKFMMLPLLALTTFLVSFDLKEASVVKANKKIILAIDAGHGGKDKGATGTDGVLEKELTLKVSNKLASLAKAYNIDAVKIRRGDDYPTLKERPAIANDEGAELFLSIHINKDDNRQELPYEMIVNERNGYMSKSKLLASALASRLSSQDVKTILMQKHLVVLEHADMPAVLLELGNITNEKQIAVIQNETTLEQLCRNILSGIVDYQNRK